MNNSQDLSLGKWTLKVPSTKSLFTMCKRLLPENPSFEALDESSQKLVVLLKFCAEFACVPQFYHKVTENERLVTYNDERVELDFSYSYLVDKVKAMNLQIAYKPMLHDSFRTYLKPNAIDAMLSILKMHSGSDVVVDTTQLEKRSYNAKLDHDEYSILRRGHYQTSQYSILIEYTYDHYVDSAI